MPLRNMNRNIVTKILIKDNDNIYRNIFTIEGDKSIDTSIYIVKKNTINPEVTQTDEERRKFELQRSIHARINSNGLVQTHLKRNDKKFAEDLQPPLSDSNVHMHLYGCPGGSISAYPSVSPSNEDIVITHKPDFFKDYQYFFFVDKDKYKRAMQSHGLFECSTFTIPVKYASPLYFSVVIKQKKLSQIQHV